MESEEEEEDKPAELESEPEKIIEESVKKPRAIIVKKSRDKEPKPKKKKKTKKFWIPKWRLKIQRKIGDEVKIGVSVTSFKSVDKSPAVGKTASDFDNANLKVKKK